MHTLVIVGVGLIGGSIGLAAKKRIQVRRVIGVGRDAGRLETARTSGTIDECDLDLKKAAGQADLIVFCTPVDQIASQVLEAATCCKPGAILTDAGSTKQQIVETLDRGLPAGVRFVGAHPLAGSEKKGAEHADPDLFVNRWTVLTPTARTPVAATEAVQDFWKGLGAKVRIMSPADHDQALAFTSHLPHLIAAALAGILPESWTELTATGFRDMTRIAGGDPAVWTPIFQQNRSAVLAALEKVEQRLGTFRAALQEYDVAQIDTLLTQGKKVRDALGS